MHKRLFQTNLPALQWVEFDTEGFSIPVSGVIFRPDKPTCCGVPLGGVATGCLDVEVGGVLGFESMFVAFPRRPQLQLPFLGISVHGKTTVLAHRKYIEGGTLTGCSEPALKPEGWEATLTKLEDVQAAREIHYFGHYPMIDMEYETDLPIHVGMRAWSSFVPGDVGASNIPAAVFELHLHNTSSRPENGTLAFSFPGIPANALLRDLVPQFHRVALAAPVGGVSVTAAGGYGYVLGVLGSEKVRTGSELHTDGHAWANISSALPAASPDRSGSSVAVDFVLAPDEAKTVRFVLSWYAPEFLGDNTIHYTQFYTTRYRDAVEVAGRIAMEHESLLQRVIAWQEVIYGEEGLPVFLRDTLINNLSLITETSYWAVARDPLGDWAYPEGLFVMNESPRGCPHIECIPCTWYGNIPINYFFPELARTTLRAYVHFMREDGAAPFELGPVGIVGLIAPAYEHQKALNGFCLVDLVDRLWMCTGDRSVLDEFYPAVKESTIYTVAMSSGPDAVISIPDDSRREWWEGFDWYGMTAHAGALRLSNMSMAARMADAVGDHEFADQCREWLEQGNSSMQTKMWNEQVQSYLLYHHPELGKRDDTIMANQLDGVWNNDFHGLPGIFPEDRIRKVLATVKESCLTDYGSVSFAKPDRTPMVTYGIFPPEIMMLSFTYLYEGDRETGLKILEKCMRNLVLQHRHGWDLPNMVAGALAFSKEGEGMVVFEDGRGEGRRTFGTDYYQNMMLWAAPAAMAGTDLSSPCRPNGLVDRMIKAGRAR
ncbi:MAG: GH116 family glycosyl-hydrolase [Candidatus Latescibacterota bacterium]